MNNLEKELKQGADNVIALMKNHDKYMKILSKKVYSPSLKIIGKSYIDESKEKEWNKFVKGTKNPYRMDPRVVANLVCFSMYNIEKNGVKEAAEFLVNGVLKSNDKMIVNVAKFSKQGKELVDVLYKDYPEIFERFPELEDQLKEIKYVSGSLNEYNKKGLEESIEHVTQMLEVVPPKLTKYVEDLEAHLTYLNEIKEFRNEKTNVR